MNVILIGFSSFVFVIGVYELKTGKMIAGEIKWLNTPLKVRVSATLLLLISMYYLYTNMVTTGMEYMSLLIGGICGYILTSDKKQQEKRNKKR